MKASPVKLLELLGDNKTVYKVPVYQRKYEWTKEQIEQYFWDIEGIIESDFKKDHFLGTMVYVENSIENLTKERIVIDGQQRITTTILILKSIIDILNENSDYVDAEEVINSKEIEDTYLFNPYGKEDVC